MNLRSNDDLPRRLPKLFNASIPGLKSPEFCGAGVPPIGIPLNLTLKNNPIFLAAAFLGARIKVELNSLVGIIVVVVWSLPKVVLKSKTGFYKPKVRAMT